MLDKVPDRTFARRWLWLAALALWFVVTSISGVALWHLRRNDLDSQLRETALLSLALTDEIDHGLHGVEQGLTAIRQELRENALPPTSGTDGEQRLSRHARLMPLAQSLWLLDRDGRVVLASDHTPAPLLSTFYPPVAQLGNDAVAVSRPFTDVDTKQILIALAIRNGGKNDPARGWILAGIPASELLGAFSVASAGSDAHMAVLRNDGVRLIGTIVDAPPVDEATVAALLAMRTSMEMHKFRDGRERLVSLHSLPRYGLKIMLTRDAAAALKSWRETAQVASAGVVLLLLILAASVWQLARADDRHANAQRVLQTQLGRASKLQSLGTLAGGVAHDFNNVLSAILGFGELARDAALPGSKQARHLDRVLQAALRGKAIVERILAFSHGGAHAISVFELEPIIEEVFNLIRPSLSPGVTLERRLEAPGARLRGEPTQLFETVMNLCTNAMQAMSDGAGILRVQLQRVRIVAPRILSHSQLPVGDFLLLTVSDQGSGISPDVMERLFQPFFTTRSVHSGIGLGLAVVHGVVAELGGAIDVQSAPGQGSRFMLYFPECSDALGTSTAAPIITPKGAGQRLMIVNDEPALLALAEEVLKDLGYEPVGYSDPVAALAALNEDPQRFAALITDEVMPELSGTQLTEALRARAPDMPVLLISGYGGALLSARAAAAGVTRLVSKPLQRADLARALAELLRQ